MLAAAVVPIARVVVDVDGFNTSNDLEFLERLYIPGLRRAGDLQTASTMFRGQVIAHDTREGFLVQRVRMTPIQLTPQQIVAAALQ
jgi:hypothetical protein